MVFASAGAAMLLTDTRLTAAVAEIDSVLVFKYVQYENHHLLLRGGNYI
ncbi:MAG TPA: hypothetical protein VFI73_10955 [Candidatus Nitrosopolaris sp.]|nr:hypothetical protein [Candidatus Nitrosopolaris sp.]